MAKKRPRGRPRVDQPRKQMGWSYSPDTIEKVKALTARYRDEAPKLLELSERLLIEALVDHAHRENLSFSEVFGVLSGSTAEE